MRGLNGGAPGRRTEGENRISRPLMASFIEPGQFVRHPDRPDWGPGQVQSAIGERVTVNFENAGKVLVNARVIQLEVLDEPPE